MKCVKGLTEFHCIFINSHCSPARFPRALKSVRPTTTRSTRLSSTSYASTSPSTIRTIEKVLNHFLHSFNCCVIFSTGCSAHGVSKLQEYQLEARNLKLVTKKAKRDKLLKQVRNYMNMERQTYGHKHKSVTYCCTMYSVRLHVCDLIQSGY